MVFDQETYIALLDTGHAPCQVIIEERTLTKQNKYTDMRQGLQRLYSLDTIIQINVVMDFVG